MSSLLNNTSNISELAIEDQLPTLDNPNAANENVVEGEIGGGEIQPTEAQHLLQGLWQKQLDDVRNINLANFKIQELPLARIKKIMKMDEDVKMISAEAPMLFAKAAQMFITELSLRAWIHTEENKRRTLQRNDIATAITKFDQFDFLIDIVPREELKPAGREDGSMPSGSGVQYFYTIPQQQTAATPSQPQQVATPAPSQILLAQNGGQVIQLGAGNQLLTSGTSGLLTSGSSAEPQLVQFVQQSPQQQLQVQKPATPAPGPAVVKNDSSDVGASINQETLQQLIANSGLSANEIQSIQITPDGQVLLVKKASNATPLQGQVVQQVHNMAGVQQQASSVMSSSTAENDDDGPTLIDIAALHHQMDQQQQQPTKSIVYVQRSST